MGLICRRSPRRVVGAFNAGRYSLARIQRVIYNNAGDISFSYPAVRERAEQSSRRNARRSTAGTEELWEKLGAIKQARGTRGRCRGELRVSANPRICDICEISFRLFLFCPEINSRELNLCSVLVRDRSEMPFVEFFLRNLQILRRNAFLQKLM